MGKLEWTENGKPKHRNFKLIMTQHPDGRTTTRKCDDRLVLGTGKFARTLEVYKSKRQRREDLWFKASLIMFGLWLARVIAWLIEL